MSILTYVAAYLDVQCIKYDIVNPIHASTSVSMVVSAHIPQKTLAKAVVPENHESRHLMAILPAGHTLSLRKLSNKLAVDLHLVDEEQIYRRFNDCDPGAVPIVGQTYNMNSFYDKTLNQLNDVYMAAGDHKSLIHMNKVQFG